MHNTIQKILCTTLLLSLGLLYVPQVFSVAGDVQLDVSTGGQIIGSALITNKFTDAANTDYYLDPAASTTSLTVAGNVGIGTTGPGEKLEVTGNIKATNSSFIGTAVSLDSTLVGHHSYNFNPYRLGTSNLGFELRDNTRGAAVWSEDGAGNVGIGTANPGAKLEVNGNSRFNISGTYSTGYGNVDIRGGPYHIDPMLYVVSTGGTGCGGCQRVAIKGEVTDSAPNSTNIGIYGKASGGAGNYAGLFEGPGYLSTAAWSYGSDRRLKENIAAVGDGLDKIIQLKPVSFDYINGVKNNLGFIAQDVQTVIPEAVSITDPKTGMLGLKTDFIIPYLVKGMQEQQRQITSLSKQLAKLIVDGVDILKKLTELSLKIESQQKQIEELKNLIKTQQ